ncbi:MAG TPA: VCBS repeat-containing protein [Desulfuromonadales bacterium]|nr:VCBS repeat-containing protein [Desulfuromonadales bacterium]
MNKYVIICAVLLVSLCAAPSFAAPLRVFVSEINAVGAVNKEEMKQTILLLLASRINSDTISSVATAAEADVLISGTYVAIGKVFSVDALARTAGGKSLARAFVQGENQDELIPAIGKLADKIRSELLKQFAASAAAPAAATVSANLPVVPAAKSDIIRPSELQPATTADFIKPREMEQGSASGWLSKRLTGSANLMAVGSVRADGSRDLFLAEDRRVSYYRQAGEMRLIAERELRSSEKIISLDILESTTGSELYVTIMRGDDVASEVWQLQGDKLVVTAEKLPYFFRVFALAGGPKKLYAQSMGRESDFYGDVFEASRSGNVVTLKNPVKMPRFGTIYTFNQFRDAAGELFTLAINNDNYLIVYDRDLKELWRSNDKFGGSELFFQKEDLANSRTTGDNFRWIFMNQRIQVTAKGEVLIGKNDGFWVLGNARSYKKGAVYALYWNGSSLEEKWRTRETQNYMPDYYLDEARGELLILQVVQRAGISSRGASSLAIKTVK